MIGTRPGAHILQYGARLRVGHPLVERPVLCLVPHATLRMVDLVNGYKMIPSGSGHSLTHTKWGPALDATTTSAEWVAPFDGTSASATQAIRFPTTSCTIAVLRRSADTTLRNGAICGFLSNTANLRMGAQLPDSSGNARLDFGGSTGNNTLSVAGVGKTTEEEAWVLVMGTRGLAIFRNGVRLGAKTTAITRTASSIDFHINGGMTSSAGFGDVQAIALFLMVEQEWTPSQARDWSTAPFSVLEHPPLQRWVPVPVAAGGASNGGALYHHFRNLGVY